VTSVSCRRSVSEYMHGVCVCGGGGCMCVYAYVTVCVSECHMCVYVDMYLGCWGNITHALEPKPSLGLTLRRIIVTLFVNHVFY
jgi:hypothetical protein